MTGFDQRGGAGSGFHDPRMPQPLLEPLAIQALSSPLIDAFSSREPGSTSLENALALILAVGGELLFQRRQLGKWRIGVGHAVALARRGAAGERPVRGAALALVAPAFVAATAVAVGPIALAVAAAGLIAAALFIPVAVLTLGFKALARTILVVLAALADWRAFRGGRRRRGGLGRHALAG